ncbi:MAG: prepilin-type N-terminal cleavage/methylation domain-containing protein [Gemmatimonadetes bacterium]|nr:prepilin-type N-terminal cleavage/methylation domain-containing protein [Gemmatimonadota bacterium]
MTRQGRKDETAGFTLIEVMGALVVFSMGVLLVLSLSGALSTQLRQSVLRSSVMVEVQEALDSMGGRSFDSLTVGNSQDTLWIRGSLYSRTKSVTQTHPITLEVSVTLEPLRETGPSYTASTFVLQTW